MADQEKPSTGSPANPKALDTDHFIDPSHDPSLAIAKRKKLVSYATYSGVNNDLRPEIKTNFKQTTAEKVISGPTNSYIILGNDRNAGVGSGLGGIGYTGCASIDLIAGHLGPRPVHKINGKKVATNKSFSEDAARLYLSQKSNIDEYLGIKTYPYVLGTVAIDMEDAMAKSAAALKADCVRIVGRENIKIATSHLASNSLGAPANIGGIDIIAGYDSPEEQLIPQPMVKGDNLIDLLQKILSIIENTQATVTAFMQKQGEINNQFTKHVHQSGAPGLPTTPMIENKSVSLNLELISKTLPDIITNFTKIASVSADYFNVNSKKYINSRYNRVN